MKIEETLFPEVKIIHFFSSKDVRGEFTKIFNYDELRSIGLDFSPKESFFSDSKKDVIRGMHFQTPPHEHTKLVSVIRGSVIDVIVDIRKESKTFGKCFSYKLTADSKVGLFIPEGFAHGFLSLEDDSCMYYAVTEGYSPVSDKGILWNSIEYKWDVERPIISERDKGFPRFEAYESPF